jgi:hypothetical protein
MKNCAVGAFSRSPEPVQIGIEGNKINELTLGLHQMVVNWLYAHPEIKSTDSQIYTVEIL